MDATLLSKLIFKIGGEDAVKIVMYLKQTGKSTEEELARKTEIKLNDLRKTVFRLHGFSILASENVQDEKTGWLIFYWHLREDQLESIIRTQKKRIIEKLETRLEFEKAHDFYLCSQKKCGRYTFEDALEQLFKCPKCGGGLEHYDNTKVIDRLDLKIKELKEEVGLE